MFFSQRYFPRILADNVVENSTPATERIEYVTVAPRRKQQQQQFLCSQQPQHQYQQQQQQQQSPYNNSLSEKETASTSSGSSTFKINQGTNRKSQPL